MATEFITPIQPLKFGVGGITASKSSVIEEGTALFKDVFSDAIQNVKDTQKNLEDKQYLLATGQIDDAHTVPIAAAEAQLSVDLLVQLRNKAVEAYNELMRISL
ncbi:flagellar hook-basal body complex protein FliE [Lachnospiraceae bacterium MD308]|jgi:flagellar hook-basal body complex protein FliE|nr:flagellar hook-basal body complex protein FliE [Lachnospiraceae bacterium MD308]